MPKFNSTQPLFVNQDDWNKLQLSPKPTAPKVQTTTPLTTNYGTGQMLQEVGDATENIFGAPAFAASGGNPLTGQGGNVPRGFMNQVTEATRPILGDKAPIAGMAAGFMEPMGGFGKASKAAKVAEESPKIFKGFKDITTKLLEDLKGRTTVSKQYILDATNRADLKQPERDLFRNLLQNEGKDVSVKDFANKVKTELLPLGVNKGVKVGMGGNYESITLPHELRGPVADYSERVYESPIKTSAGGVHFDDTAHPNYFAHTRIEDLPKSVPKVFGGGSQRMTNLERSVQSISGKPSEELQGTTRRVIELQSDLFQKGRLESEQKAMGDVYGFADKNGVAQSIPAAQRQAELAKLEPYRNTWHERVIREEVKQAAKDGKTKLQFPTGETAMKIEGLGAHDVWFNRTGANFGKNSKPEDLKIGHIVQREGDMEGAGTDWIITDVLGDGKFKAVPKDKLRDAIQEHGFAVEGGLGEKSITYAKTSIPGFEHMSETFDISGKVDTSNPIYRFYEKEVGRYLTNKYGAKLITDPQGVRWYEVPIKKELSKLPVEAFGAAAIPLMGQDKREKRGTMFKSNTPLFLTN